MKVKMFANSNIKELEDEINAWLSSHKVKVDSAKQNYTCDDKSCYALVSLWFESLESITEV